MTGQSDIQPAEQIADRRNPYRQHGRAARLAGVLAAATLVASGCGAVGQGSTAPRPDSPTSGAVTGPSQGHTTFTKAPCSLLTSDEVADTFGRTWATVVLSVNAPGAYRQCAWSVPGGGGSVVLAYLPEDAADNLRTLLGEAGSAIGIQRLDIGDGAVRIAGGLQVLVGDGAFQLVAIPAGPEIPLASRVAARLR